MCSRHLELAVDLVVQSSLSIAADESNAVVDASLRDALREIELDEEQVVLLCDPYGTSMFPHTNGSTLLLEFLTDAASLQERCIALAEAERCPASAQALAAVPLTRCLPHALRACLRCSPALDVLRWTFDWAFDALRVPAMAHAALDALDSALNGELSAEWRAAQQRGFAAALSHADLWRFSLSPDDEVYFEAAKLNRCCFLFDMRAESSLYAALQRAKDAPAALRTRLVQLVRALLEFGLQLLEEQLASSDTLASAETNSAAPDFHWEPKFIELDKSPEPEQFFNDWSASTQLLCFWLTALQSELLACKRSDGDSSLERRIRLALRLRAQATLTGLLFDQLDDTRASARAVRVFDFRYSSNVKALFSLLEENLCTLSALGAPDIDIENSTEWPGVELVYKRTLRLLWTLTYPLHLIAEAKCANNQQKESIEEIRSNFECVLTINKLVNELIWSIQLPTNIFLNLYLSIIKERICKIMQQLVLMRPLFDYAYGWRSYMKRYNNALNQFYQTTSLDDYSNPFSVPSLVLPSLVLSRHELSSALASIHRTQLHDEAVLFHLTERCASGAAGTGAASSSPGSPGTVCMSTKSKPVVPSAQSQGSPVPSGSSNDESKHLPVPRSSISGL